MFFYVQNISVHAYTCTQIQGQSAKIFKKMYLKQQREKIKEGWNKCLSCKVLAMLRF